MTVEPASALLARVLVEANVWNVTLAGRLCLARAVEADPMPENARQRIHVRSDPGASSVVQRFEVANGVLLNAEVVDARAGLTGTELSYLLGKALGVGKSTDQLGSIMSYPNTERTSPGPSDQESLRALYGPPTAWCR